MRRPAVQGLPPQGREVPLPWARARPRPSSPTTGSDNLHGRFALGAASSGLFEALCHRSGPDGPCAFKSVLTLPDSLACDGKECGVDTVRVVELTDAGTAADGTTYTVYYEYLRERCVDLSFFENPTLVVASAGLGASLKPMCADPTAMMAESTCCAKDDSLSVGSLASTCEAEYSNERVTFATAQARCAEQGKLLCDFSTVTAHERPACTTSGSYFWSTATRGCEMFVQVNSKGAVAVVDDVPERNVVGLTPEVAGVAETARTYSSVFARQRPGRGHARSKLGSAQAWSASHRRTGEWMQLDFGSVQSVVGIAVQGRADYTQYVKTYTVDVRDDENATWVAVAAEGGGTTFSSSSTGYQVSSAMFAAAVQARFVRISPLTWTGFVSMRADAILEGHGQVADFLRWTWSAHSADSKNFFRARWAGGAFPQVDSPGGGPSCGGVCMVHGDTCMCPTTLVTEAHFVETYNLPTRAMIVEDLKIRHADPALFDGRYVKCTASVCNSRPGVVVWQRGGDGSSLTLDDRTVFQVSDGTESNTKIFYRNMRSTIRLQASAADVKFSFRNPPSFHARGEFTARDAEHETDALLEYYSNHPNNAPFIASNLIQRFVTSNPSPRYVKAVATAFKEGAYRGFGEGKRGDLAATLAAVLLDDEARSPIVANDPAFGKVQEPIIKVLHLLRSLEFRTAPGADELQLNYQWGQTPYNAEEGVFSFFQYNYQPSGAVQEAGLVAPEALLLSTPNIVSFVNNAHGLIKFGLSRENFGYSHTSNAEAASKIGNLTYTPTNQATGAVEVLDELDDLLTGGRLNAHSRMIVETAYNETLLSCTLCGNVRSTGVPEGVTLTSTGLASCNAYTGCGTGTALARWQISILPTATASSGIRHRPTDPSDPNSLWVQGSNGKRFQIASVSHISYVGKYTFINPAASNDLYRPEMLDAFNEMFPVGTTFSFVKPSDPGPPPRTQCALCAPEATQNAQQLMVTTPEFHTTAPGTNSATQRTAPVVPAAATNPYKAVVFMYLAGGVDSYNVLVPKDICAGGDMYEQYRTVRSSLALSLTELLTIDTQVKAAGSEQVCMQWGLHPKLPTLQRLFNNGDALFVANAGLLITPITKEEYRSRSKPIPNQMFNHGAASKYIQSVDCTTLQRANGVLGRMMDSLDKQGFNTQSYSASGRGATVLKPETRGREADYKVMSGSGVPQVTSDFSALLADIRDITSMESEAPMAETWAGQLNASLDESKSLGDAFNAVTLAQPWSPVAASSLSRQMEMVAKLIKAQATGALTDDRQAFYVRGPNFDSHSGDLLDQMKYIDAAMASFEGEMQAQGMWDSVTVVQSSDFGRSLSSNGDGSDHGWGGNYWVAGGSVRGGQILGSYPNDISANSEFDIGRGRMIPTTSWDMIWHGVAEWFGVDAADMGAVIPNKDNFPTVFHEADMFETA